MLHSKQKLLCKKIERLHCTLAADSQQTVLLMSLPSCTYQGRKV